MIVAIVLVIASVIGLAVTLALAASRSLKISQGARALEIQPIDVLAFRNLADPAETNYLRQRLPIYEFQMVQRERLRAMAAYVSAVGRNAAILVRMGEPALSSNDPNTAEAARQLVDQALLLRRNAAFALFKIYIAHAWPTSGFGISPVLSGYERLNGSAMLLGRLQNPSTAVRIAATS